VSEPTDTVNWLVYLIGAGGLVTIGKGFWDWRQKRQELRNAAPESRANAESKMVATAEQVVELVEERMKAQATEIAELRKEAHGCTTEVKRLTALVDQLERELHRYHQE
jgi:hypothetical protein